ncbi:MAG: nitrate reductase subunit beta [Ignavibacteria bacterium RIFOXYB2_FULL_35_12]|nr:MAG: nitrate reductase subunit beta [Ignavibacteria bacterium GWA2_36_19]OGU52650.1 MAG: nitrate reductase subunit beta [Ignavibacteria bacterium GWC2_35_8]OGU59462.1 MAG: nitrate reductase subunit beta [Ignavibacteria bacterium GWF2_35_20]OGU79972.1 MAG: nitrate reductase subunit beta [Ignavibacteria bacterium RIFOXYA2_FULL_35_9]OGU85087.1 MAG: nitrate reductase subunit beta [Ignavibacteria bacterium RIFOXYA12_FULL_35_25]OGU89330.1 MAG: nitrate reductase subunit beta [Ignavibacteria bacter
MDVRSQTAMLFHLDKCIGCHTCSIACKNIWTDRKGAEYMWWNNVETKPGTGYPTKWENQSIYKGGWKKDGKENISLRGSGKFKGLLNIFHNPYLPVIDDYYEPWTYKYLDLIESPQGDDQPTAIPVSLLTGKPLDIKSGPNWDDDLSGTPEYARKDPNFENLSPAEQEAMFQLEKMAMFYLPRICNHCLNPACVASCPSGAIYKRGEDGVVLINQKVCRAWRMCVTACPYKKSYYNWGTGKSEKCILCYPRLEAGYAPACMHSCVGRIRYLGVLLYDADKIKDAASAPDNELIEKQLDLILDPFDENVIRMAKENGIADSTIFAAQTSPIYKFVKVWGIGLPLHAEYRTLPMLFYVAPLLPVMATLSTTDNATQAGKLDPIAKFWDKNHLYDTATESIWGTIEQARFPLQYLANMFGTGNEEMIKSVLKKQLAVRIHRRSITVGDIDKNLVAKALIDVGLTPKAADDIYYLTSLAKFDDRFNIPPAHREQALEMLENTGDLKGSNGFGFKEAPMRGM